MLLTNHIFSTLMDSSSSDLIKDFFIPALKVSEYYDRGVGYFSSGWLRVAAEGMIPFAAHGGRARWVTSPILDKSDWDALQAGDEARADPVLRAALRRNVGELAETIEKKTLSALAWMVADEIITFKLALPRNKLEHGEFHDKFGVFTDTAGNQVCFNGSYNDSIQGTRNYESIKIFCSWHPVYADLVQADVERFDRLWNNQDLNVRVFDLPEAAREHILQLREGDRPYPVPPWMRVYRDAGKDYRPVAPAIPSHITLRDYQKEAVEAWFAHDCKGLLEMATGTGKTITALAASTRLFEREDRLAVVIAVPYQHLVDQWNEEAQVFGHQPLLAYQSKARWLDELNRQIIDFNAGYRRFISVITTHTTFINREFQGTLKRLDSSSLLIADEAHHLGAERSRHRYPQQMPYRLALSATPDRWFDDIGTQALRDFFGETVFSLPLDQAIGISLTPYYYYPHLVPLTDEEMEQYEAFSAKIAKLFNREDEQSQDALKMLLIKRANLLNTAINKIDILSGLMDEQGGVDHALFYCAPAQIDEVIKLLGWRKGLLVHRFTAEEDTQERQRLLEEFADGRLHGLVAMRCLDEGVDVPDTRTAFILASSSNPREFIQRRGRILRQSPGKDQAVIHDLIAVPPNAWLNTISSAALDSERSIMRKELQRFKEFANPALNKHQSLDVVWDIAKRYRLMDF